jgi:hypothetical protein
MFFYSLHSSLIQNVRSLGAKNFNKWSFSDFIPLPKSEKMFIFSLFGTTLVGAKNGKNEHFFQFFAMDFFCKGIITKIFHILVKIS